MCRKRKAEEVDGVSKKIKKEEEDERKKLEEQLKVLFFFFFKILLMFGDHIVNLLFILGVCLFCCFASAEPKSAHMGNQGQAEEVLFH